ncbi:MAG: MCE family protein [Flavobacterium sp.]|nr:MCE family protein [Flavobacterium sp.]
MKVTREVKTAILVIASILLFIWGYTFLKGKDLLNDYKNFYVNYDNVEGLGVSAPVTINGLVVGRVVSITLQNSGNLVVELQVKTEFPISKSSVVNIYEPGLIGGKQIQIVPNLADTNLAESGDTLQGGVKPGLTSLVGDRLTPLQEKVEKMVVSADLLLTNINTVFDDKTKQNIRSSVDNLNATLAEFRTASANLNSIIAVNNTKINNSMTNIEKASANFAVVSDTIAKANIGKTIRSLEQALAKVDNLMTEIESGNGTLGKLAKDDALYNNLAKSSRELELLLQDVRLNPTRYINISVFGKKNKPYTAPKVTNDTTNNSE